MALEADGSLLVAEAGVVGPADEDTPVEINTSGRVLRITPARQIEVLADGLPFTHDAASGTDVGPADVALLQSERFLLTREGHAPLSRLLLRLTPGAPPQQVVSVLNFAMRDILLAKMVGGAGVQANPFAMAATPQGGAFFLSDGASGRVLRACLDGAITVFVEVPGMPPLTGMAFGPDGRLYVAVFSVLPHTPGTGALYVLEFGDGRSPMGALRRRGRAAAVDHGRRRAAGGAQPFRSSHVDAVHAHRQPADRRGRRNHSRWPGRNRARGLRRPWLSRVCHALNGHRGEHVILHSVRSVSSVAIRTHQRAHGRYSACAASRSSASATAWSSEVT